MTENEVAIIGLDGLSPGDLDLWDFDDGWSELEIESVVHTCPSWNTIFSGRRLDEEMELYDFFKKPKGYDGPDVEMAKQSDEMWTYDEIRTGNHIWERPDIDVDVVSAPVVLPTFSTLDQHPGNELAWCTERTEFRRCIQHFTELTLEQERVITVYPLPDKMKHMMSRKEFLEDETLMPMLVEAVDEITDAFDRWVLLSDHGDPSPREYVDDNLWVASHHPTGVIKSNAFDTDGYTNRTVYKKLVEVLKS